MIVYNYCLFWADMFHMCVCVNNFACVLGNLVIVVSHTRVRRNKGKLSGENLDSQLLLFVNRCCYNCNNLITNAKQNAWDLSLDYHNWVDVNSPVLQILDHKKNYWTYHHIPTVNTAKHSFLYALVVLVNEYNVRIYITIGVFWFLPRCLHRTVCDVSYCEVTNHTRSYK